MFDENFTEITSFQAHSDFINRIKLLSNGYVATASADSTVKIWDISSITTWSLIQTYSNHTDDVYGLEYINEDTMSSGSLDNTIQIWSISTGLTNKTFSPNRDVWSLQLLSNGFQLAAGLGNGYIYIYNINTGIKITLIGRHVGCVFDLAQIHNDILASSGSHPDYMVRIWNLTTNTLIFNLTGHNESVCGLKKITLDLLASGSIDNTINLWNITDGTLIRTLRNHTRGVAWAVDLLNSELIVSAAGDSTIKIWKWNTGEVLNTINVNLTIRALTVLNSTTTSKLGITMI